MITYFQAIVLGLLQGISELFPISSLGHSVILPQLLGWNIHQQDSFFLTFLVGTHLATATVLFCFFWRDWFAIFKGMILSVKERKISAANIDGKLGWLLVAGTIPAGLLGLLLEKKIRVLFAYPAAAAFFILLNGLMLYGAERLRRNSQPHPTGPADKRLATLSWNQAIKVGTAQIIALIPGFSRSGSTMAGGYLAGLSHEDAAHYSFLLATPIIGAAAALKLPELFKPENHALLGPLFVGAVCAAIGAYIAVKFLMKFFKSNSLKPFAIYCLLAGGIASIIFLVR